MIRVQVTDELRSYDIKLDAPYSPDVLQDVVHQIMRLAAAEDALATEPLEP